MIARTRAHWGAAAGLGALFLALVLACALRPGAASADAAAGGEARRANPHLGERDDAFMDRQAKATLDLVDEVLTACPPALEEPIERRLALYLLDNVFHDVFASERAPVVEYFQSAMARTVENIERTKVRKGAVVWKLWNHAFVVRTKSVTLGFDVIQRCGMGDMAISDELLERLVSECDVLFVSHEHLDHAEAPVAQLFVDQGKPVCVPPDLWADAPFATGLTRLERTAHVVQPLAVRDGKKELGVVNYPGTQEVVVPNNVVVVFTPEGMSFAHTGDEYSMSEDFAWIDEVGAHHRVDVLLVNCWAFGLPRVIKGFDPELVITGHENEMRHPVCQREPYWKSYQRLERSESPYLVMAWGESFLYTPPKK